MTSICKWLLFAFIPLLVLEGVAQEPGLAGQPATESAMAAIRVQEARLTFLQKHPRNDKNKRAYNNSNLQGWVFVNSQCFDTNSPECAQASIIEVETECAAGARFFRRDTKVWTIVGFSLVLASATFTAIGASSTLANAKIFSTLGGTTGLGAVTASVNANVSADTSGLVSLQTTATDFLKFVQSGGESNKPADNVVIYKSAPLYALRCTAAANATSGSGGHN